MPERVIINADDFGLAPGVNRGIIECHKAGVVTSTTLMVNGGAVEEAAALAAEHPELGVGLHLNLSAGEPVLTPENVPSLVTREGVFPGKRRALLRLSLGSSVGPELDAEIEAQVERCRQLGIEPTHVDSHHHLHAHPFLRRNLVRVCRRLGINKMRTYNPLPLFVWPASMALATMEILARSGGFATPDYLVGIEGPDPRYRVIASRHLIKAPTRADFAGLIEAQLRSKERSIEVMCHPGYCDTALDAASSYTAGREDELRSLKSPEVAELIENSGVRLMSYREL